jgi:hypothetical protein
MEVRLGTEISGNDAPVYAKKGDVASEGRARRLLAMLERAG